MTTTTSSIQQQATNNTTAAATTTTTTSTTSNLTTTITADKLLFLNGAINNHNNDSIQLQQVAQKAEKNVKYKKFNSLKEREEFLHKLKEFHKLRGTPINNYPSLNGKLIDLLSLYEKVTLNGGWEKVCEKEKWDEIACEFNIPSTCINGAHALKTIYIRYLSLYERVYFFQEESTAKDEEDESRRKFIHIYQTIPMTYNNYNNMHLHNMLMSNGASSSNSFSSSSNSQSSIISTSQFINSQSINASDGNIASNSNSNSGGNLASLIGANINSNASGAVTSINNDLLKKQQFSLSNFEKLENSLICGLPNEVDFVFNTMLLLSSDDTYSFRLNGTNTRLINLILASIGFFDDDIYDFRRLYDQWRTHANRNFVKFWHDTIKTDNKEILGLLPTLHNKYLLTLPSQELLNLKQEIGTHNAESQRIEQAMIILNNMSFDEHNIDYLSKSTIFFHYLIMCSYCTYTEIRKLSLDILTNICQRILLQSLSNFDINCLFYTIKQLLLSNDRYEITRGLEILTKICINNENEDLLAINLDTVIYEMINQLLTVQDLLILTHGLECLYQLTHYSETICNQLVLSSKSVISLLISYLTVDLTYFQTNSIKLVELRHNKHHHQHHQHHNTTQQATNAANILIATPTATNNNVIQYQNIVNPMNCVSIVQSSNIQEQQAKVNLCNWFKTCFIYNQTFQISKTELYLYYKHISKLNNWPLFPIPTFFELLQQTFPNMKLDENTSTIFGLKLAVNNLQQAHVINTPNMVKQQVIQTIPVNNVIIQHQQQPQQQHQVIKQVTTTQNNQLIIATPLSINNTVATTVISQVSQPPLATTPTPTPTPTTTTVKVEIEKKVEIVKSKSSEEELANNKTLQLNINESSSSSVSSFSSSSSSSSASLSSSTAEQKTNGNDNDTKNNEDDANIIEENINYAKVLQNKNTNDKSNVDESKLDFELEKVGEAEQAMNILFTKNNLKLSKIERVVNEAIVNGEKPLLNGKMSDNEKHEIIKNHNSSNKNNNNHHHENNNDVNTKKEHESQPLVNGHSEMSEENDDEGEEETIKSEKLIKQKNGENDAIIKNEYVNGYKAVNGKLSNKSELIVNNINENNTKLENETEILNRIKKRKKSVESPRNSISIDEQNGSNSSSSNGGSNNNHPVKKRQKKINEMDIPPTKQLSYENNVNKNNNEHIKQDNGNVAHVSTPTVPTVSVQPVTAVTVQPQTATVVTTNGLPQVVNTNGNQTILIQTNQIQPQSTSQLNNEFLCEWNNCKKSFTNAKAVYNHVYKAHLASLVDSQALGTFNGFNFNNGHNCLWCGCDQIKRQKWALVSHIQERHCTEQALRNALICRQKGIILQANQTNTQISYSKDAALIAIHRAHRTSIDDFVTHEDSPVAKSIRLLAALSLRNLAANSSLAKKYIKQYESYLSNIAFDLVESSNAIANCLWQLSH